ncbi:uncharacterized protein LOC144860117 [Branchiostoma floridae x Branchiostoma japonicum]
MDETQQQKLRVNHSLLKFTILVHHITWYLQEKGILTKDEVAKINSGHTQEQRTEQLLFLLPKKQGAYEALLQSLKGVQEHGGNFPYTDILQLLEEPDHEQGKQLAGLDEESWNLVRKYRKEITEHLDAKKACMYLVQSQFLTEEESATIQEEDKNEMTRSLLSILPTKKTHSLPFVGCCMTRVWKT